MKEKKSNQEQNELNNKPPGKKIEWAEKEVNQFSMRGNTTTPNIGQKQENKTFDTSSSTHNSQFLAIRFSVLFSVHEKCRNKNPSTKQ